MTESFVKAKDGTFQRLLNCQLWLENSQNFVLSNIWPQLDSDKTFIFKKLSLLSRINSSDINMCFNTFHNVWKFNKVRINGGINCSVS